MRGAGAAPTRTTPLSYDDDTMWANFDYFMERVLPVRARGRRQAAVAPERPAPDPPWGSARSSAARTPNRDSIKRTRAGTTTRGILFCVKTLLEAMLVNRVDIVDPNRHPDPLVADFVAIGTERVRPRSASSTPLRVLAKEDLAIPRADPAEPGRITPLPALGPSKLFEPIEAGSNIGNIQNGRQSLGKHSILLHAGLGQDRRSAQPSGMAPETGMSRPERPACPVPSSAGCIGPGNLGCLNAKRCNERGMSNETRH